MWSTCVRVHAHTFGESERLLRARERESLRMLCLFCEGDGEHIIRGWGEEVKHGGGTR